jgi:hypothetical protein
MDRATKAARRRQQNRLAAQTSRERKKQYINNLEQQVEDLKMENQLLKQQMKQMKERLDSLESEGTRCKGVEQDESKDQGLPGIKSSEDNEGDGHFCSRSPSPDVFSCFSTSSHQSSSSSSLPLSSPTTLDSCVSPPSLYSVSEESECDSNSVSSPLLLRFDRDLPGEEEALQTLSSTYPSEIPRQDVQVTHILYSPKGTPSKDADFYTKPSMASDIEKLRESAVFVPQQSEISIEAVLALVAYLPFLSSVSFLVMSMLTLASEEYKTLWTQTLSTRHPNQDENLMRMMIFLNSYQFSQTKRCTMDTRRGNNKASIRGWSGNSPSRSFLRRRTPYTLNSRSTFPPILQPKENALVSLMTSAPPAVSAPLSSPCRSHQTQPLHIPPFSLVQSAPLVH